jgi:hypothetical protein
LKKIKTFEDACKALKIDPTKVPDFSNAPLALQAALIAHYKLVIIAQALNKGWTPDWNNYNEYKYYPWFWMEKTQGNLEGFACSGVGYDCAYSSVGSRLCFKTREIAEYAGKQFIDLYKAYMKI